MCLEGEKKLHVLGYEFVDRDNTNINNKIHFFVSINLNF